MPNRTATLVVAVVVAACVATPAGAFRSADPAADVCFGAAARDPQHNPCTHPTPTRSVRPTPRDAQIEPGAPCTVVQQADLMDVCAFGAPAATASETIALVGDSHAGHWRGALEVVAQAENWQGLSITRDGCALSFALRNSPEPARSQCLAWSHEVVAWFRHHPEVHTVFISSLATNKRVIVPLGRNSFAGEAKGYRRVWKALPGSVRHIVVLRDVPRVHDSTSACIQHAMARHEYAGLACSVSRRHGLVADAGADAARAWPSARVQLISMTRFFCGRHRCYPVIGGALVYKDGHHLTRDFAATLGPYVLRKLHRLMATWH